MKSPEEKAAAVQVPHMALENELIWRIFTIKVLMKEGIQYYTLNFLWHFTRSILGKPWWPLFQKTGQLSSSCTEVQGCLSYYYCYCPCGRTKEKDWGELLME